MHKAMAPLAKDRFPSVDTFRAAIEPFWLAIRSPSSVHTSHNSLSFSRLTPIPSQRSDAEKAPVIEAKAPAASAPEAAPVSPKPIPVEQATPAIPPARQSAGSMPTSAAMPVVPDLMIQREPRAPRAPLTPVLPPRVAKTLPPEDPEEPQAVATPAPSPSQSRSPLSARGFDGGRTAEGEPPVDSQVPSREPTPLGGFYPYNTSDAVPSTAPEGAGQQAAPAIVRAPGGQPKASAMASAPTAPMPQIELDLPPPKAAHAPVAVLAPLAVAVPAKASFEPPPPPPPREQPQAAAKAGTVKMPVMSAADPPSPGHEKPRAIAGTRAASLLGSAAPGANGGAAFESSASAMNGSGTAEAAPLFVAAGLGAGTAEAAPLFVRAAKESHKAGASKSSEAASAVAGDRTAAGGAPPPLGSGTAQGSGLPPTDVAAPPIAAPNANPAPPPRAGRKVRRAAPLALVVLLAGGVSAAVVGGVYVAHRSASVEDHNDDPIVMPTPTAVHADPQPGAVDPAPTSPVPSGVPGKNVIRTQPTHPGGPHAPLPPGSAHPSGPHPPGSVRPPDQPPGMLPIIIPSGFPFPFPGPPPGPPPSQPPQAEPSGRPHRGGGGLPPLEPIPRPPPGAEANLPEAPGDR